MRRTVLALLIGSVGLLVQESAGAGGWWTTFDLHGQYIGTGESLSVKIDEILFDSIEAAERAENNQYFVYVVEDFDRRSLAAAMSRPDPGDWWRPLTQPVRVGTVSLAARDGNLFRGRAHIDVPDMPAGRYFLMLCDDGCKNPLANHIPVPVNVTTEDLAARTARRLERTNERLTLAFARLRRDVRLAERGLERMKPPQPEAAAPAAPQQLPAANPDAEPPWIAYTGWFLAGAALMLTLINRRQRRPARDEFPITFVPDDARELTKTP